MDKKLLRDNRLAIGLLLIIIVFSAVIVYARLGPRTVMQWAQGVLGKCKLSSYRPSCYDTEIPKLLGRITMEEAFAVTKIVQDKDPSYLYCHVLGHKLSFVESQRHPREWKDILSRCPPAMCNYGCLHGSLVQRFRGEVLNDAQIEELVPVASELCEERKGFNPTDIDKTMCYHALGHFAMYATGGKPDKSIAICKKVSKKADGRDYTDTCVQAAFMNIFQGVDPEDIALVKDIKPQPRDVPNFCNRFGDYWQSCRRESFPLFRTQILEPGGFLEFCSYATSETNWRNCSLGALNIVADSFFDKPEGLEQTQAYCRVVPNDKRATCYAGISQRLVQIEPDRHAATSIAVCKLADSENLGQECYRDLLHYSSVSYRPGDRRLVGYCQDFPPQWRKLCLEQKTQ